MFSLEASSESLKFTEKVILKFIPISIGIRAQQAFQGLKLLLTSVYFLRTLFLVVVGRDSLNLLHLYTNLGAPLALYHYILQCSYLYGSLNICAITELVALYLLLFQERLDFIVEIEGDRVIHFLF